MSAATYDITIEQGATWLRTFEWRSGGVLVPLAGLTARMQVREKYASPDALVSLTSEVSGGITLTTPGRITMKITDEVTAALDFKTAVWDLEIEDAAGDVRRLVRGTVTLSLEVTRPVTP